MNGSENEMRLRLITRKELAELLSVSEASIERWLREKADFPRPIQLSANSVRWRLPEVLEYINRLPTATAYQDDWEGGDSHAA